jgi:hypothetical protein
VFVDRLPVTATGPRAMEIRTNLLISAGDLDFHGCINAQCQKADQLVDEAMLGLDLGRPFRAAFCRRDGTRGHQAVDPARCEFLFDNLG